MSKCSDNDQQTLYLTTKMLLAHAQAIIPTSTSLIQASLLLATYEYAHSFEEAAYISIGTCARMGYAVGLHNGRLGSPLRGDQTLATLKEEEDYNLWWGLVTCERYGLAEIFGHMQYHSYAIGTVRRFIMSETPIANKRFVAELPDMNEHLPVDFDLLDQRPLPSRRPRVSDFRSQGVGSSGREVQAAYLHTNVQETISKKPSAAIEQLKALDHNLQRFFRDIICQAGTTWGTFCGSISFTIG